ncbi:hypothetical protein FACS1894196_4250 [Clostridia bacterium]|nr:hypothetical protein FACS1894196_4250 [Clostridia bacterium]
MGQKIQESTKRSAAEAAVDAANKYFDSQPMDDLSRREAEILAEQREKLSKLLADGASVEDIQKFFSAACKKVQEANVATQNADKDLLDKIHEMTQDIKKYTKTAWAAGIRGLISLAKNPASLKVYSGTIRKWLTETFKDIEYFPEGSGEKSYSVNSDNVNGIMGDQIDRIMELFEKTAQKPVFGDTIFNSDVFKAFHGTKEEMSPEDWVEFVQMLLQVDSEETIRYGGSKTSAGYINGVLYLDCWGLVDTAMKLYLTKDAYEKHKLNGGVDNIYRNIWGNSKSSPDESILVKDGKSKPTPDGLKTGSMIFVDNNPEHGGYDHVLLYIKEYEFVDEHGQVYTEAAVIDIGMDRRVTPDGVTGGLQVKKFDDYISKTSDVAWGNPFQ